MVIQAYIFLNEKLEPHLSFEEKSVKYNLSSQKEASKPTNDAPAPLPLVSSSNRPIAPAPAQQFQGWVQNTKKNILFVLIKIFYNRLLVILAVNIFWILTKQRKTCLKFQ